MISTDDRIGGGGGKFTSFTRKVKKTEGTREGRDCDNCNKYERNNLCMIYEEVMMILMVINAQEAITLE